MVYKIEISHDAALQLILTAGTIEESGNADLIEGMDEFLKFAGKLCDVIDTTSGDTTMTLFCKTGDSCIAVRDIISRIEELEELGELGELGELETLTALMCELEGCGGDENWRDNWYPGTLIRDSYFTEYAKELVIDCYELNIPDFLHIDWESTAREVRTDYVDIVIEGFDYCFR